MEVENYEITMTVFFQNRTLPQIFSEFLVVLDPAKSLKKDFPKTVFLGTSKKILHKL